jgi:hypothetical protein
VPYFVDGSIASSYSGVARATQDVDLIADFRISHTLPFVQALKDQYYISEKSVISAIRSRKSFNIIHLESIFKIDIFVLPQEAFAHQAMSRRVGFKIQEISGAIDFCSAEDIVLAKLRWYEMGNQSYSRDRAILLPTPCRYFYRIETFRI